MTIPVSGEDVRRLSEIGEAIALLSVRGSPIWTRQYGVMFRVIPIASGFAYFHRPTKLDPGPVPGRLPIVMHVISRGRAVLDMHFSELPDFHLKVELFERGFWEEELLQERFRPLESDRTGGGSD